MKILRRLFAVVMLLLTVFAVFLNVVKTFFVKCDAILFAKPKLKSDSCVITGILSCFDAITTGSATYPPFENTTLGFNFFKMTFASLTLLINLNGSSAFLKVNDLTSFTGFI